MPITWDVGKVEDYQDKFVTLNDNGDEFWNTNVQAVVYGLMGIGYDEITEKNHEGVAARLWLWERIRGAFRGNKDGDPHPFTLDEVKSYIGFTSNARKLTDPQFLDKLMAHARDGLSGEKELAEEAA